MEAEVVTEAELSEAAERAALKHDDRFFEALNSEDDVGMVLRSHLIAVGTPIADTAGELVGACGRAKAFWMRRVSAASLEAPMSLRPTPCADIPANTAAAARAAFPKGNVYLRLRDELGTIFTDAPFAPLFASRGQPAACPWRLALVTLLQFAENLSDRRAAEAVRSRIDWKYLLGLELTDPGFDASVLSEFRGRLVAGGAEQLLFDTLLTLLRARKPLRPRGRQRTDSTHVLGAVRGLNRLECAIETLRAALNALASAAPDWLRAHADPDWGERYAGRAEEAHVPPGEAPRRAFAEQVGRDGHHLLAAVTAPEAPIWLREVPAVGLLRRVWVQSFCLVPPEAVPAPTPWRTRPGRAPGALAGRGRGLPGGAAAHQLALRSRGALRQEAYDRLDRL